MQVRFKAIELVQLAAPSLSPSIADYLQQVDRLVGVIADPKLTRKLTSEQYQLKMQPIGFLELYQFQPIVTLRVWCDRQNIVHLESLDYQLKGLEAFMDGFTLKLVGTLAAQQDQQGNLQLMGKANLSVALELPPPLWLTPRPLLQATGDHLLSEVLQRIKQQILRQLLRDYRAWAKLNG